NHGGVRAAPAAPSSKTAPRNCGRQTARGIAKLARTTRQLRPLRSGKTTNFLSRRSTSRQALAAVNPARKRSNMGRLRGEWGYPTLAPGRAVGLGRDFVTRYSPRKAVSCSLPFGAPGLDPSGPPFVSRVDGACPRSGRRPAVHGG